MLELFAVLFNVTLFIPLFVLSFFRFIKGEKVSSESWGKAVMFAGLSTFLFWGLLNVLSIYTEVLWFDQMGQSQVYWTIFKTRWLLFLATFAVVFLVLFGVSSWILGLAPWRRAAKERQSDSLVTEGDNTSQSREYQRNDYLKRRIKEWQDEMTSLLKAEKSCRLASIIALAVAMGCFASYNWEDAILWLNQLPTGSLDPVFGKDISFYLFSYPWLSSVLYCVDFLCMLLVATGVYAAWFVIFFTSKSPLDSDAKSLVYKKAIGRASLIVFVIALVIAMNYWLSIYGIMFGQANRFHGPGYTAANHLVLAYKMCIAVVILSSFAVVYFIKRVNVKKAIWTTGSILVVILAVQLLYPLYVQKRIVEPSEFDMEQTYMRHSISFTRQAYGLAGVEQRELSANDNLTTQILTANQDTLNNIRLWDYRVLKAVFQQKQGIRTYYGFGDIDVDRYMVNGKYRQVMLGARELNTESLPEQTKKSWVDMRTTYTHGYGLCMNGANEASAEGFPNFLVKDMPSTSAAPELKITKPQIYFGEKTNEHVYVGTTEKAQEFDYGRDDKEVYAKYKGNGGVKMDTFIKRLAFAWEFNELNLLLSEYIDSNSKVMFHRNIGKRVGKLTPFLLQDNDSYPVIREDGSIDYIIDHYSASKHYPYAEPYGKSGENYIRNSVKAVVSAYDGTVSYYLFDETDPVIKVWKNVFPSLFKAKSAMPADLMKHIRYPEDLMDIQSRVYATYHMENLRVFFGKGDLWAIAKEILTDSPQEMEAYYTVMRLPSEKQEEFVLMRPFTPAKKDNMVGWLAARSDGPNYGKLIAYMLPKGKMVTGPMQIESKIDQHPEMSEKLSLWKQKGSEVIRGDLLAIPIGESFIYVEPIYTKAVHTGDVSSDIPQLVRVVVAYGERIAWAENFATAFAKIFGQSDMISSVAEPASMTGATPLIASGTETHKALLKKASSNLSRYYELMGEGKPREAGEALEELKKNLEKMNIGGVQ